MTLHAARIDVAIGGRRVLHDVSVTARAGEFVAVLGANGAGKSTLLRSLAGLLRPTVGRITLNGNDLTAMKRDALGRALTFLPQDRTAHWPMTVRSIAALGRRPHGARSGILTPADEVSIERALAAMDVTHLAERPITALSGGERARVLIARALAQETPILIADEPVAGLDPAHQLALCETLGQLAGDGRTVITALHDLSLAARYASHVVMLLDGRVVAAGPAAETLDARRIAEVFRLHVEVRSIAGVTVVVPLGPTR